MEAIDVLEMIAVINKMVTNLFNEVIVILNEMIVKLMQVINVPKEVIVMSTSRIFIGIRGEASMARVRSKHCTRSMGEIKTKPMQRTIGLTIHQALWRRSSIGEQKTQRHPSSTTRMVTSIMQYCAATMCARRKEARTGFVLEEVAQCLEELVVVHKALEAMGQCLEAVDEEHLEDLEDQFVLEVRLIGRRPIMLLTIT